MRFNSRLLLVILLLSVVLTAGCDRDPANEDPVADFMIEGRMRPDRPISFDGTLSHDRDGFIERVRWNFGDGTSATSIRTDKTYSQIGDYRVSLTVYDNEGGSATHAENIRIEPNQKPIAAFSYTTPTYVNRSILFDASDSYDPDGEIVGYKWLFGTQSQSTDVYVNKTFGLPGIIDVTLIVFDDEGDSSWISADVDIDLSGYLSDCGAYEGCFLIHTYPWPPTYGPDTVVMGLSSSFMDFDPGWVSISSNTALYAMAEWQYESGANINFRYYTDLQWDASYDLDGLNIICAEHYDGPGGTLGVALYWINNGYCTEVDVLLDHDEAWGINGESDKMDLQSVCTHEFGHVWRLMDLEPDDCHWETMHAYSSLGETYKRTLYCGDKNGMIYLYGGASGNQLQPLSKITSDGLGVPYPRTVKVSN